MSQQEVGQSGKVGAYGLPLDLLILHQVVPGTFFAKVAQHLIIQPGGGAVPQVINTANGITGVGQVLGQLLVPQDVLAHAVADLYHSAGVSLRQE